MILRDRLGPAQTTQPGISPASHSPRDLGPTVTGTVKVKPLLPQTMGDAAAQNPSKPHVGFFGGASSCSSSWGTLPAQPPPSAGLA